MVDQAGNTADAAGDSALPDLPPLSWRPEHARDSLDTIYEHAIDNARRSIAYYASSSRSKKRWARRLRVLAIVLVTVAGILPVLSQIADESWTFTIAPAWATVVLGLAVGLVLLDRFFGVSSAWARFISTELAIKAALGRFQIHWQQGLVDIQAGDISPEDIHHMLGLAEAFLDEVEGLVEAETNAWIKEFQESLQHIDELSQQAQP